MLKDKVFVPIYADKKSSYTNIKITVIGCGPEGMTTAFCILNKGLATELALIDLSEKLVEAEIKDLQNAREYLPKCDIYGGSNYKLAANSTIIIMCCSTPLVPGETKLNHVQRNLDAFKRIIPHIVESSPKSMIIVLSRPVDIMTYIAWRLSGFPKNRVFGIGTMMESSKFRIAVSQKLSINALSVNGYVFGEQGSNSVPIWSSVECAGVKLRSVYPEFGTKDDKEGYNFIPQEIAESDNMIDKAKGCGSWSLGLATCRVCEAVLHDLNLIFPLSTYAKHEGKLKGMQGIDRDIFISLPCLVNANGVRGILFQQLSDDEKDMLTASAKQMDELIQSIEW